MTKKAYCFQRRVCRYDVLVLTSPGSSLSLTKTAVVTSLRGILLLGEILPSRTVTVSIGEESLGGTFSLGSRDLSRAISQRASYKSAVCCMALSLMARFSRCSN